MDALATDFTKIGSILDGSHNNQAVKVRGWVHRSRTSGGLAFIVVRDSSGTMQCAVKKDAVGETAFAAASGAFIESSIMLEGTVKEDKRAPGGFELSASKFEVICQGEPFPIGKDQSTEFLLDVRHLWLRSQKLTHIMRARDHITRYLREFFFTGGFYEVAPPIITRSACEGGSTLFELNYFGSPAFLSQSGQLYSEAIVAALEKVFILAPSFRAEPSRTIRHLAEYWHLEPEMAFYSQKMNMELQEKMIEFVCQKMANEHADLLTAVGRDPADLLLVKAPFERLPYEKAIPRLQELGFKIEWGQDVGADEEFALTKDTKIPIFLHNHPKDFKAFYMREDPAKPGTVLSADLLAPQGHGEIIGGSERIWEYDELAARMKEQKMREEDYKWYVELRKYGSVPHAGFGLGIERLVKWMLNLDHIRDTIPFPRVINRVYP
ncbi:MAG: asparagine--tRNA ligase [Candidatus Micrarchaeia archaeon]|jgi:asparaginyl-tRNA synthetase